MKKKEIFQRLNDEMQSLTPPMSEKLKNTRIVSEETAANVNTEQQKRQSKPLFTAKRIAALCAALALVITGVWGGILLAGRQSGTVTYDAYVTLDINPSFSLIADSEGKVVSLTANNRDAEIVLIKTDKTALIGKQCGEVVDYITETSAKLGYFTGTNNLKITAVSGRGDAAADKLLADLRLSAENVLSANNVSAAVEVGKGTADYLKSVCQNLGLDADGDVEDLLEALASVPDYLVSVTEKLGKEGDKIAESVKALYRSELLEEYVDLLEERAEILSEIAELNDEIKEESKVLPWHSILGISGWQLIDLADEKLDGYEDLAELKGEFAELLAEAAEAGLSVSTETGFNVSNLAYNGLNFGYLEEKLEELEEAVEKFADSLFGTVTELMDHIVNFCLGSAFSAEWNEWAEGLGNVTDVESYVEAMQDRYAKEYEKRLGVR